ncbi:MBL fold metallo-hydrolase [Corticibacter populi]|uniref:MBL fold metallo-hydrolase n=1 Tax=Corticibacter populi TaxID=1550736 RepID=A0A3M6QP35_9BURK|nr:MBL fold metallo-hydrolase [Corticibacter populi]RMX04833.1 MBL fold metallo-hydrolase [Corticibacter populi]RZS33748.1 glyoxylase-like metal-dependent hydrolase (beta-lactamase superfamily II) [Corticibacter populi]
MVRPHTHLHPPAPPAAPRLAVSLILVRDAPADKADDGGIEVLLSRRSPAARFVPGAYVFPGGSVDAQDARALAGADARSDQSAQDLTLAHAAVRESLEEVGILLARTAEGAWVSSAQIAAHIDRHQPLAPQIAARGWRLALDAVFPFGHWTTDRDYPIRFDVPFLIASAPQGQQAEADGVEQFDPLWIRPAEALRRHADGQLALVYPTVRSLRRLAGFDSAEALLAACARGPVMPPSCPRAGLVQGREERFMEHELPFGELALVCPDGQLAHELAWQSEQPVALLRHLRRLTAPNAGVMTGPGTNTYLIGEPATGYLVLDPGPDDAAHLQRIMAATNGDIRHIVCTHSHPDHSPGARPLQALVETTRMSVPPITGMASRPTARADSRFTPDRELASGDELQLHGQAHGQPLGHTLLAVHTPGHAANHLCFLLKEDALLFSGDHILGGTTTVISLPDGNMQDYLDSLTRLDTLCETHGVEFVLPAHGHVLHGARQVIAQLRSHRLRREARVLAAVQQAPQGAVDDWLALAYADTPRAMWPVARHSLLAHLQRLATLHPQFGIERVLSA